ncbi:Noc2p family-domain-containing protein [Gorgonomyces haynaldii]|nr:Noc2p family-domain-containing protein [Gorgonomyces haynaldii]
MAVKKSTKKFIKNHLKDTLKKRKEHQKNAKKIRKPLPKEEPVLEQSSESEDEDVGFVEDHSDAERESDEELVEELDEIEYSSDESENEDAVSYKQQLENLKETDPKFFEYLKKNDAKLLEFEEQEEEEEDEEEELPFSTVQSWADGVKNHSLKALKEMLLAFKNAIVIDEDADRPYTIQERSKTFNLVLLTTLEYAPQVFDKKTKLEELNGLPSSSKTWKKIQPLVKSFLSTLLVLLKQMTDRSMLSFALKQSEKVIPYFCSFPKLGKEYLKVLVAKWSNAPEEQLKILSFLCIRRMAMVSPNPFLDFSIKHLHKTFLQAAKVTNHYTWNEINFMINSIVELGGLHLQTTYQHMFVQLRQLAVLLRDATMAKANAFKKIYHWQFLHCLRLWSKMCVAYCNPNTSDPTVLQPLVYPLVQIMTGVLRLKPTSKHFPFRLHLVRLLLDITECTGIYIPVGAYLLEVFESSEFKHNPKPSTLKPLDFQLSIKCPNTYLGTRTYGKGLVDETLSCLFRFYALFAGSISFPELVIPTMIQLKRLYKKQLSTYKDIHTLLEKLEQNYQYVLSKRNQVSFGPNDLESISQFDLSDTPFAKYYKQRQSMEQKQPKNSVPAAQIEQEESDQEMSQDEMEGEQLVDGEQELDGDEDQVQDFAMSESDEE